MNISLSDNQEKFIAKLLAKEEINKHILVASPGTGKTTVILKLIERMLTKGNTKPFLLLGVHNALITLFYERIRIFTTSVSILDKKSFLEMDYASNNDKKFWKDGWVYISTTYLLKDDRFVQRIKSQNWELIAFDEANKKIIEEIEELNLLYNHMLFAMDPTEKMEQEKLNNYSITEWKFSDYISTLYPPDKLISNIFYYLRTNKEKQYFKSISEFIRDTLNLNSGDENIEVELTSSWFSIEQLLLKIRNALIHGQENIIVWEGQEYTLGSYKEAIVRIEDYLNMISNIEIDSKIAALIQLLSRIRNDSSASKLIFVKSIASINYLNSALNKKGFSAKYLHQSLAHSTILEEIDSFNKTGGIMLVNDYILKGLQLSADVLIHYDLPSNESFLFLRYSHIPNKVNIIRNYFLVEEENESDLIKIKKLGIVK